MYISRLSNLHLNFGSKARKLHQAFLFARQPGLEDDKEDRML